MLSRDLGFNHVLFQVKRYTHGFFPVSMLIFANQLISLPYMGSRGSKVAGGPELTLYFCIWIFFTREHILNSYFYCMKEETEMKDYSK